MLEELLEASARAARSHIYEHTEFDEPAGKGYKKSAFHFNDPAHSHAEKLDPSEHVRSRLAWLQRLKDEGLSLRLRDACIV